MQSSKIYNASNVIKALCYIRENSVMKERNGIIVIQDRNEMVQMVLSDKEREAIVKSKFINYNYEGHYYELNRYTFAKANYPKSLVYQRELFD